MNPSSPIDPRFEDHEMAQKPFYRFDKPGTLTKPGPIGRLVRLALGALLLFLVEQMFRAEIGNLRHLSFWFWALFMLWLFPAVINIGFGRVWGNWLPRILLVGAAALASLVSFRIYGDLAGPPVWWLVRPWIIYVAGHLGISFILAGILATPGCEMRAIPHLVGLISGRRRLEHYCPGFIDNLDRWEQRLRSR